jgi:D-sedoheptulose 7-phosphate isomerase
MGADEPIESLLNQAITESMELLPSLLTLAPSLAGVGDAMMQCWQSRGKVLIAGNGGSMADAMHFAEELTVRFRRNRRALAAMALCDVAAVTCAGNDYGYETIFSRQVEALGNPGDILIVLSTSGKSQNIVRAVRQAKEMGVQTVSFLGNGGDLRGVCDFEILVQSSQTARIQEAHKVLFHTLCDWIDSQV